MKVVPCRGRLQLKETEALWTWILGAAPGWFATDHGATAGAARSTPRHSAHDKARGRCPRRYADGEPTSPEVNRPDLSTPAYAGTAGGQLQRQRQHSQGVAPPSLSPRQWPACGRLRTYTESTHARSTDHLHPHTASSVVRLALLPDTVAAAPLVP